MNWFLVKMTDSEKKDMHKPKAGAGDIAHAAIKTGLSAIPVIGGPAAELFSAIVTPPLVKRRDEWVESIVRELGELEGKFHGFSIEELSKNEVFITTVTYATMIAVRNHQKEKIDALRNAVLNTALSPGIEEDQVHMFLNYVDAFTPWHMRILMFFDDPKGWAQRHQITLPEFMGGAPSTILKSAFSELADKSDFYRQVVKDLSDRGLMSNGQSLNTMMTYGGAVASRTTSSGKSFIRFISSPQV
jgi:hypothetical protein